MAGEWKTKRFGQMAYLVRDTVQPSDARGLPYIALEHIGEGTLGLTSIGIAEDATSTKSCFSRGDILFGKLRPYFRKVVRAPFDGICSTDIWVLRPQSGVDGGFLFYLVASKLFVEPVVRASEGTKMPRAKWEYAASLDLPLPPLPEQRAIAHILGTLDDKIELNRRMNRTLEEMARALFKSWFVDFDPVRAKAAVRREHPKWTDEQVSRAACPKLKPEIAALFPDSFVESELGEIPKGWEVRELGDLIDTVKGRSYKSEELVESDTALVTLKSFARGGGYRPDGLKPFAGSYKAEQVVCPGEVVIACTDVTQAAEVIGRPAIVRGASGYRRLVASLDTLIVRPRGSRITRAFLYFLCGTEAFVTHTYSHTTGTTVLHLAKEAVPSFTFACPSERLVQSFNAIATPALDRIQALEEESRTLAALRDALLPRLISGELRVKDAEKFLGKVL